MNKYDADKLNKRDCAVVGWSVVIVFTALMGGCAYWIGSNIKEEREQRMVENYKEIKDIEKR